MDDKSDYPLIELTRDNFPCMDREPVLDWMRELHPFELAHRAREAGYDCANMKNPEQSVEWMNFAMAEESEWRDLPLEGVRFWKIFYYKWRLWMFKGRPK